MTDTLVRELICTRLSHDIIGNIGAVANAVELLEEGDMDFLDDIKSILKTSSQTLSSRLKFFRLTFGLNNPNLDNAATVLQTATDYVATLGNKDYPISVQIDVATVAKRKQALLMIMILADLLIRGGQIKVTELGTKLMGQITQAPKISTDKLDKIKQEIYSQNQIIDAGLAPLFALREQSNGGILSIRSEDNSVQLTME